VEDLLAKLLNTGKTGVRYSFYGGMIGVALTIFVSPSIVGLYILDGLCSDIVSCTKLFFDYAFFDSEGPIIILLLCVVALPGVIMIGHISSAVAARLKKGQIVEILGAILTTIFTVVVECLMIALFIWVFIDY
jgi:hypothetical protein